MKKLLIITLLFWQSVAFANDAEFQHGVVAFHLGDYNEAFAIWKPLAEQGHVEAQHLMGHLYDGEDGRSKDYSTASLWYLKAARQRHPEAALHISELFYHGQENNHRQSNAHAYRWLLIAQKNGLEQYAVKNYNFTIEKVREHINSYSDELAASLQYGELQEAEEIAEKCKDSGDINC